MADMVSINEADNKVLAELDSVSDRLQEAKASIETVIFGQEKVIDLALIAILAGGHALLVGLPGLAKTKLAITLGQVLSLDEDPGHALTVYPATPGSPAEESLKLLASWAVTENIVELALAGARS